MKVGKVCLILDFPRGKVGKFCHVLDFRSEKDGKGCLVLDFSVQKDGKMGESKIYRMSRFSFFKWLFLRKFAVIKRIINPS